MKNYFFLLLTVGFFFACDKEEDNPIEKSNSEIIGEWTLMEVFEMTAVGGSFHPVDSDKQITFHSDGTISSNGDLCSMSMEANSPTTGTYSLSDSTFSSSSCPDPEYKYVFEQSGDTLTISYPCTVTCEVKFKKN